MFFSGVFKNMVGGDLVVARQEAWRRKTHTPDSKRAGPNKTCRAKKTFENIGGVSTHLLAGAIWFDARGRIGGSARLDFGGGGVDFWPHRKSREKKLPDFLAPKRSRRNLTKSKKSEGGVQTFFVIVKQLGARCARKY